MPTHTPKLLGNVEILLQNKLKESLAKREELVVVATGLSKAEADRTLHKLRAMRAGLKQYQPVGSELQLLAANKHIRFTKVYEPSKPDGRRPTLTPTHTSVGAAQLSKKQRHGGGGGQPRWEGERPRAVRSEQSEHC